MGGSRIFLPCSSADASGSHRQRQPTGWEPANPEQTRVFSLEEIYIGSLLKTDWHVLFWGIPVFGHSPFLGLPWRVFPTVIFYRCSGGKTPPPPSLPLSSLPQSRPLRS